MFVRRDFQTNDKNDQTGLISVIPQIHSPKKLGPGWVYLRPGRFLYLEKKCVLKTSPRRYVAPGGRP